MAQDKRDAEIISIEQITPTVKLFRLRVVSYQRYNLSWPLSADLLLRQSDL